MINAAEGRLQNAEYACKSFHQTGNSLASLLAHCLFSYSTRVKDVVIACRCQMRMLDADVAMIVLDGNDQGLAAGQYVCLYQEGVCLGSAVITGSG